MAKKKLYNLERKIVNALRKLSRSNPLKYQVLKGAKNGKKYRCNSCKKENFRKEYVRVDHIEQVGEQPVWDGEKWEPTWDYYIFRLNCPPIDNLQVLCLDCHEAKSETEKQNRKSS